jgi:nucleotide-binding universal stress UspA family protein
MYKRILLAYDGSVEGRTALREGALLARQCGAQVFLLSVLVDTAAFLLADVVLGFDPVAKMVRGEPAEELGAYARQSEADLVVVGHRRQSAFARWWSGPRGAYLMDYTDCSLLVARNLISDEAIEAARVASSPCS